MDGHLGFFLLKCVDHIIHNSITFASKKPEDGCHGGFGELKTAGLDGFLIKAKAFVNKVANSPLWTYHLMQS